LIFFDCSGARFRGNVCGAKDGKEHRYSSVVENRRVAGGWVLQRHVLYLGEINSSQELAWRKSIDVLEDGGPAPIARPPAAAALIRASQALDGVPVHH
jgi:hypothetical protein